MLMIIPYQVDSPSNRWPIANYIIIAITAAASVLGMLLKPELIKPFMLDGWSPGGLIGYMWLHEEIVAFWNIVHLIGNLLFLWLFGNAVCSKAGNLWYAPIYVGLGVIAGVIHLLCGGDPVLGAGGAINGMVGIFLVWFPVNAVSSIYIILVIIRTFTLDSYWMIAAWLAFDIWGTAAGETQITYYAHLGGFPAGAGLGILLLKTNLIKMEETEKSLLAFFGRRGKKTGPVIIKSMDDEQESKTVGKLCSKPKTSEDIEIRLLAPPPPETVVKPPPAPSEPDKTTPTTSEQVKSSSQQPADQFIRFQCDCGKTIKAPPKHAGKIGRCPRCSKKIRIPQK